MRLAALDVGSNSFHLIVAQVSPSGRLDVLERAKEMVRLGEETLRTGVIPPELFKRGLEALRNLRRVADRHQPDAIVAVATSAVREAQNGGEFVRAARDDVGIEIRVITGREEARLIYLGARSSLDLGTRRAVIVDVGGGSTEVILADAQQSFYTTSLKMGVLRLADGWHADDPPSARDRARLAERVRATVEPVATRMRAMGFDFVALSSGTAQALAALAGRPDSSGARTVRSRDLKDLEDRLAALTTAERARQPGLDPRRAETILPGAVLIRELVDQLGVDEAVLCDTALREGLIADYAARNRPGIALVEEFPDRRRRSVMELARHCRYEEGHAHQVARLALSLFRQTRQWHELAASDGQLLEYAALLHDIGTFISVRGHHRHSQYLISTHDMKGFSPEEVSIVALVARYHRKAWPRRSQEAFAAVSKGAQRKVRTLAAILRLADSLDRTHASLVRDVSCTFHRKTIDMRVMASDDPELELWAARRKGDLFESLTGRKLRFAVELSEAASTGEAETVIAAQPTPRPKRRTKKTPRLALVG